LKGLNLSVLKHCLFDSSKRCYKSNCDVISASGSVSVCRFYRGGDKFTPRKSGGCPISIFSLLKGRGRRVERGS
jgi:hypothetical protein